MGKSKHQSSNGVVGTGDSSESDGSQNHDKAQGATKVCNHISRSVDQNQVKKNISLEDIDNNNFCQHCSKLGKSVESEDIYVCLRCGIKACSIEHSKVHYEVPRSDPHHLYFNLRDKSVWCHECGVHIEISANKKLKACVDNVKNMYEKHQKRPIIKNSPKIEPIAEENESENKLIAVPILPPKTKSPNSQSGVKGLWNLGNTCYFNSVLQCLAQTPNLIEFLRETAENKPVSVKLSDGRTLTGELERQDSLCEELAETLSNIKGPGAAITPQKVLNLLRKRVQQFRGNDQHDAHELLRHLLDSVRSSDLKRYRKIMLNELGLNGASTDLSKVDSEKQKELKQLDREVTDKVMLVPDQVFRGYLVSRLECQECHQSSECVESFLDLSLPVTSEKPHPPSFRRKGCGSTQEEKGGSQMSKHQIKKERRERRKNRSKYYANRRNELGHGDNVPSISEKGESDAEGDDGDVDSEESDIKTDSHTQEMLCAGISIPTDRISRLNKLNFNSPISYPHRNFIEGTDRSNVMIPLTDEGVPDISKVTIYDSTQPKLKTYMRDSETIAKEEPSWLTQVNSFLSSTENGNFPIVNENSPSSSSKSLDPADESKEDLKEKEVSSDDKTLAGENSTEMKDDSSEIWNSNHEASYVKEWDDNIRPPPPPPPEPLNNSSENFNDTGANSDDEVMVGSLFEENNGADGSNECSVQTCLGQFTGIELMTGSNKVGCETCTKRANKGNKDGKTVYTMSTKQLLISEAPPVLILHIKRFQVQMSSFRKLSRHVAFPLELDISSFCKVETVKNSPKKLLYSLYGIVEHSGNFNGGHYVAYVKVDSRWFCISDSYVNEVKESRVLQAQAYLLFYKSS